MHKKVYLAGPIGGLTYDDAQAWRTKISKLLDEKSDGRIKGYSPLRGKEVLRNHGPLSTLGYSAYSPLATPQAILTRDYNDCRTADLIIADLTGEKISIGTVMEIAFAYAHRVPTVAILNPRGGEIYEHVMLEEAISFRTYSLDGAADMACSILLP
jgi:nucleoside 2-deoxyribosyltransferase